ncbi:MAG: hypothetical protein KatS3mg015_2136 [Fimbriimonadales bacterium]|nr:MAG: hypothetical protein KatS3mg015_2136 [Fimbriimonadales bacterium]
MFLSALGLVIHGLLLAQLSQFGDASVQPGGWYRLEVRHADPWVVAMLLRGESPTYPEMSTLGLFGGASSGTPTGSRWLIPEGTLIVNPADNSILYRPYR